MDSIAHLSGFAARLRGLFSSCRDPAVAGLSCAAFETLALELFEIQYRANEVYHRWCRSLRVDPARVRSWKDIPALPAAAFKESIVSCLPPAERTHFFESSRTIGATGSRHFHSNSSLELYADSCWSWFRRQVAPPPSGTLISLTPPPSALPHSSLVHMFEVIRLRMNTPADAFTGSVAGNGDWVLQGRKLVDQIETARRQNRPVCLLGTAFLFVHLFDWLRAHDRKLELPHGSRVMETGGYKGKSRVLTPEELYAAMHERLGVSVTGIVSEYGMSELSSQAYAAVDSSGARSIFRFPPWARFQIIDPESGRELSPGTPGLIRVLDLANVFSVLSLQTADLGVAGAEGLHVLGRAETAEPKGCSLMAGTGID